MDTKVIIINNIDIIWGKDNVLNSVVEDNDRNAPAIEVYSIPDSLEIEFYKYRDIISNNFVQLLLKSDDKIIDRNLNNIIDTYLGVLNIGGYSKKMLTDLLFEAINEPNDIEHANYIDILDIKNTSYELISEYEAKLHNNREFYYELYRYMVKLLLPLMNEAISKYSIFNKVKKCFIKKLNSLNGDELEEYKLIDNKYTFDSFVSGKSNEMALNTALKVANDLGNICNPLYIYGDVGLGKTHLLKAIGNYVFNIHPEYKIIYVQAMDFLKDYTDAVSMDSLVNFEEKYDDVDLLLFDDIQMINDKKGTQQQFFKLFQNMIDRNKQIVITSYCPPNKLNGFMDRITSRFQSGIQVNINRPDFNHRLNILKRKRMVLVEKDINDEVLSYIANNFKDNVRELEGALKRINVYSDLKGENVTLDFAKEILAELLE